MPACVSPKIPPLLLLRVGHSMRIEAHDRFAGPLMKLRASWPLRAPGTRGAGSSGILGTPWGGLQEQERRRT